MRGLTRRPPRWFRHATPRALCAASAGSVRRSRGPRRGHADSGCNAAHRKPTSSRATATVTTGLGLCSTSRRKRRHNRCWALSASANHPPGLSATPPGERLADAGPVPIVPCRFHHQPSRQRVARLRDRPAAVAVPAGVLPGHQAEIRHQRPRGRKPLDIVQLRQQQHRRQRVDSPKAPQPAHRFAIRFGARHRRQLRVQLSEPRIEVVDRQQVVLDDHPVRRMRPTQTIDPAPVRLGPRTTRVVQPPPKQELAEAGSAPLPVRACVITSPAQGRVPPPRPASAPAPPSTVPPGAALPASARPAGRS